MGKEAKQVSYFISVSNKIDYEPLDEKLDDFVFQQNITHIFPQKDTEASFSRDTHTARRQNTRIAMNTFVTALPDEVSAEELPNNLPSFGENHTLDITYILRVPYDVAPKKIILNILISLSIVPMCRMLSKIMINNLTENGIGNKNNKDFQTDFNVLHLFGYTCRAHSSVLK